MAERNKNAHSKFCELLSDFQHHYKTTGFDRTEAFRLMETLLEWLTDHICSIERKMNFPSATFLGLRLFPFVDQKVF